MELSRLARLLASPRCVRCALPPASGAPSLRTHSAFRRFGSATGAATPTARQIELAAFREELRCASPVDGRVVVDTHSNRHVATLTFDNAAARNALTGRMMAQLGDAVQQLRSFADAGGVGLVICGSGGSFCSGAHLQLMQSQRDPQRFGQLMCRSVAPAVLNCASRVTGPRRRPSSLMACGDTLVCACACRYMHHTLRRVRNLPLVSVAVVRGAAVGGGSEMATVADFRVFADDAYIQFKHAQLALSPGWGGATR